MLEPSNNAQLPEIPSKRYFTIGEVSELCDVKPHVLRYWEQEFPQLKPVKRRGNRRYYQRQDVMIIRNIRSLLYEQGYTIGGARLQLTETVRQPDLHADQAPVSAGLSLTDSGDGIFHVVLQDMIKELEQVATLLRR
jgi:DNA-binding transcriptional MerR regulator